MTSKDFRTHFDDEYNEALITACQNKDIDTAKLLLKNPKVNPTACDNLAIVFAVETGNTKFIELFIKDSRVPNVTKNNAIEYYESLFGRIYTPVLK